MKFGPIMVHREKGSHTMHDIDQGNIPLSVFLDLSKAFDTLNHNIILKKLNPFGEFKDSRIQIDL